jgi:signal peptidase II
MRWIIFAAASVLGLMLDLGTKCWAFARPDLRAGGRSIVISGWCDLALVENPGAAFGLMGNHHALLLLVASTAAIGALAVILHHVRGMPRRARLGPLVLGLVVAGIAGNFHDRMVSGHVRDFIDCHTPAAGTVHELVMRTFGNTHYPTFNVADVFVLIGAIAIFVSQWRDGRQTLAVTPAPRTPPDGVGEERRSGDATQGTLLGLLAA